MKWNAFDVGIVLANVLLAWLGMRALWLHFEKQRYEAPKSRKRRFKRLEVGCYEFYRVYKYMYMQLKAGITPFETMRRLYLSTENIEFGMILREMSTAITHSSELEKGIDVLKQHLVGDDAALFISILEGCMESGFSVSSIKQLDGMLFQKHLIDIKKRVKQVKRRYLLAAMFTCSSIFIAVILPMVDQMLGSLGTIFTQY